MPVTRKPDGSVDLNWLVRDPRNLRKSTALFRKTYTEERARRNRPLGIITVGTAGLAIASAFSALSAYPEPLLHYEHLDEWANRISSDKDYVLVVDYIDDKSIVNIVDYINVKDGNIVLVFTYVYEDSSEVREELSTMGIRLVSYERGIQ